VQVRNDAAQDGLWKISGKRQVIYARNDLSAADRLYGDAIGRDFTAAVI
jgi:hypothetical protein